ARAGEWSAREAAPWLLAAGYGEAEAAAIVQAVARSSWSAGLPPAAPLDAVLQDADRLDAIGACGIMRVFSTAQSMQGPRRYYHTGDPMGRSGRALDDRQHAVDHFKVKLLRLAEGMHLPLSRAEAWRRHQHMEAFLEELQRELVNPEGAGDAPGEA
ncbi:MAG: HD domain-containing protein, partial [Candidatus Xenobia bacterium]